MAEQQQPSLLKSFVAGGVGGMSLVLVGHPFDTIKVRVQTMTVVPGQPPPYSGVIDCAQKIMAKEGVRGLFRGMAAPLYGVTPMYALCFFGYGVGKKIFCDPDAFEDIKMVQIGLAGAFSALFTTPILAPGERLKCVLQVQGASNSGAPKYSGPMDVARALYKEGGLRSVFRGSAATLARDGAASFAYFSVYELLKKKLTPEGSKGPSVLGTVAAGGLAGWANWMLCLPLDTLKTRLQVAPEGKYKNGIRSVFVDLVKTDGLGALYRGFGPVMVRAFPANAACFVGYETAIRVLDWMGVP